MRTRNFWNEWQAPDKPFCTDGSQHYDDMDDEQDTSNLEAEEFGGIETLSPPENPQMQAIYTLVIQEPRSQGSGVVRWATAEHTAAGLDSLRKQARKLRENAWIQTEWERI
tara:strand:- start:386 stop:718 length:333 start_codon:yes stop_codon:yes gene_type:complete